MKKIILIIFSVLLYMPQAVYAIDEDSITIVLMESDREHKERPDKGKRIPSRKETCVIDFNSLSIQSSLADNIISYELRDDSGQMIYASYTEDSDMVEHIYNIYGSYQILFITESRTYLGYIEL